MTFIATRSATRFRGSEEGVYRPHVYSYSVCVLSEIEILSHTIDRLLGSVYFHEAGSCPSVDTSIIYHISFLNQSHLDLVEARHP